MQFKKKIAELTKAINKGKHELERINDKEARSRKKWTAEYGKYMKAAADLAAIKIHNTAKEKKLQHKILDWPKRTVELTKDRDSFRTKAKNIEEDLIRLGLQLTRLTEQQNSEAGAINEIVIQVFSLNDVVVRAAKDREECLKRHVFPRLMVDGKLSSQVSFTSTDGLRRVVAIVNTMTLIQGDLANMAKLEIEKFFSRFQATAMTEDAKMLFELTKHLLVEKTNFKVGPELYKFLSLTLDEQIFPELSLAQHYLRQSIRSEKTNKYIRLYERTSTADRWEVVPQS